MKMILIRLVITHSIILFVSLQSLAQNSLDSIPQERFKPLIISTSVVYGASLFGLNELWYSDFERESFHFFNDHDEWKQMDKVGHFFAGFHLSQTGYKGLKWAGQEEKKSIFYGALFSTIVLTPIEIFDGFSSAYGASYTDIIANTAGTSLFYLQQKAWGEIKIHPKFSFRRTDFSKQRPELLGNGLAEELLKDYNGQTYWLSFDLSKIVSARIPKWLNLALGYGATNMISADDETNESLGLEPKRQFYLAIDFDFNKYKSRSKLVNSLIYIVNLIHLPAPTLEFGSKLKFHPAYH